jgi:hypothetical protein
VPPAADDAANRSVSARQVALSCLTPYRSI